MPLQKIYYWLFYILFPLTNFCTSHRDEILSIACSNVFLLCFIQGQLSCVAWKAPFFGSEPQVVICGTAVSKQKDIMVTCDVCCPLLVAWMDGNHTGRLANQRQQPWKWRIRPVCQGGQRKCYCMVIAPAGSYTNTLKRHLACCLPTLIFSKRSWLRQCQRERVSHYYNKTIATSQAEKTGDFVFIRELLSHQLSSQGRNGGAHTRACMHWGCSRAILFKRLVPYSSPLNEAVNLETRGPLQCSSEGCYNDLGTELVN